ncbi:hypothetical protein [Citrobacter portucalensis]|uniref:hypothetical protein n=1 Tax=Citrobacter portucalensis TaxID=1639133 RepID=UPI0039F5EC9B
MKRADIALQMNSSDGVDTLDAAANELVELAQVANELDIIGEQIGSIAEFLTGVDPMLVFQEIKILAQVQLKKIQCALICLNKWLYALLLGIMATAFSKLPLPITFLSTGFSSFFTASSTKEEIRIQAAGLRHGPPCSC